jgi:hypothetical protein
MMLGDVSCCSRYDGSCYWGCAMVRVPWGVTVRVTGDVPRFCCSGCEGSCL